MKRFIKKLPLLLALSFVALFMSTSCEKDLFNPDKIKTDGWDPTFALPLTNSTLSLKNLIPKNATTDQFLNTDSTSGALSISYKGDIFNIKASDVVKIPNQVQSSSFNFDVDSFPSTGFEVIPEPIIKEDSIHYNFEAGDSVRVHSIGFNDGSMRFSISTNIDFNVAINVSITSLIKNNVPASLTFNIEGDGTSNTYVESIDLTDYALDMTLGPLGYNELIIDYTYTLSPVIPAEGKPAQTVTFEMEQGFYDIVFGNILGDLGNQVFPLDRDSLVLSIFENTLANSEYTAFEIAEPTINILVTSSIGVPLALNIIELSAYEPESNTYTPITLQSNSFNILAPANIGDEELSIIAITGSNSNLNEIVTPTNKVITYELGAELNPNGQITSNFITPDAEISIQAEIELPLEVGISDWILQDTIDFSLEQFEFINTATLRVVLDNGFPFSIDFQVYLLDETNVVLDSLINTESKLLVGAQVDINGDVIASSLSSSDIGLSAETIANLGKTKRLVIRSGLSTSNNGQRVKLYDFYELNIRMGMKVGIDGDNLIENL
ncbi:MAG: hypothetical protein ACJAUV_000422 [Flavobacteriales bacterium]|jgi:hypothetical protein